MIFCHLLICCLALSSARRPYTGCGCLCGLFRWSYLKYADPLIMNPQPRLINLARHQRFPCLISYAMYRHCAVTTKRKILATYSGGILSKTLAKSKLKIAFSQIWMDKSPWCHILWILLSVFLNAWNQEIRSFVAFNCLSRIRIIKKLHPFYKISLLILRNSAKDRFIRRNEGSLVRSSLWSFMAKNVWLSHRIQTLSHTSNLAVIFFAWNKPLGN